MTTDRMETERRNTQYFELLRAQYETPDLGGFQLYAGAGVGAAYSRRRVDGAYTETLREYDRRDSLTSETTTGGSSSKRSRSVSAFGTAYFGCRADLKPILGIDCTLITECAEIFGKERGTALTVGTEFKF